MIRCRIKLFKIASWTIARLPKSVSAELPSRSMVMIEGSINAFPIQVPLEPDGAGSHWFRISNTILEGAKANAGDTVSVAITPSKEWPAPELPVDLKNTLAKDLRAHKLWTEITTKAQWDWIRWIRSAKHEKTRKRRIEIANDKLKKGDQRPCCFNRTMCTEPYVAKNGVLLESNQEANS